MQQILLEIKNPILNKVHHFYTKHLQMVYMDADIILQKRPGRKNEKYYISYVANMMKTPHLIKPFLENQDIRNLLRKNDIMCCDMATVPGYLLLQMAYFHDARLELFSEVLPRHQIIKTLFEYGMDILQSKK